MHSSIENFRKYCRLERENGYTNTAVIGGLGKIWDFWEGEARLDHLPEDLLQAIGASLRAYENQTPEARAEALITLWKQIYAVFPEEETAKKNPPASPPEKIREHWLRQSQNRWALNLVMQRKPLLPLPHPGRRSPKLPVVPQRPGRADSHPGGVSRNRPIALNAALTVLAGVGPRHAVMLSRLGLNTLGDLLYNFPRRYDDYSSLKPIHELFYGQVVTVIGTITTAGSRQARNSKLQIFEAITQRWHWQFTPHLLQPTLVGQSPQGGGCCFRRRQGGTVPRSHGNK